MPARLSRWLTRVSTGRVTLALVIILVAFTILVLPGQSAAARSTGGGAGSPDTSLWYSAGDLYRMAEAYGPAGRQAYVQARFTFDILWPLVYVSGLSTALSWLLARAAAAGSRWRLVNLAPALAGLLDLGENVATSLVMLRYPALTPGVDSLAAVFTLSKWAVLGFSFLALFAALANTVRRAATRGPGRSA